MGKKSRKGEKAKNRARLRDTVPIYILGWLLPGAGHWLLGQRARGILLFFLLSGLFIGGLLMEGGIVPASDDIIGKLCFTGCLGNGLICLGSLLAGWREGKILAPFHEIGTVYMCISGILNFLALLRIPEEMREDKKRV